MEREELYFETVLRAAIGINQHKLVKEIDPIYEKAIKYLSDYFSELSNIRDIEFSSEGLTLTKFYWPSDNFPKNLKGKTLDNFRLHSWLFAKDLSTFKEASINKQKNLIDLCCDLHGMLLTKRSGRYRLAA